MQLHRIRKITLLHLPRRLLLNVMRLQIQRDSYLSRHRLRVLVPHRKRQPVVVRPIHHAVNRERRETLTLELQPEVVDEACERHHQPRQPVPHQRQVAHVQSSDLPRYLKQATGFTPAAAAPLRCERSGVELGGLGEGLAADGPVLGAPEEDAADDELVAVVAVEVEEVQGGRVLLQDAVDGVEGGFLEVVRELPEGRFGLGELGKLRTVMEVGGQSLLEKELLLV